ncbi:mismatch-specific DNA-glycosylase [Oleiagrimonas sp. C23AA]|uniref:mismatch-specific DNA-glycosylase n=1 Tax=Oleiagrimonas sp. C23AA TaxID=2719047 RepID=UPI00141F7BF7|nr:mismatch-specific DNA-glycosylase [Oleiagrimonas sp. C23AA]NII11639.1 mismatch-specific DNA-glycosylase [Oleiagrimonas sp. C23AA]
MSRPGILPDVLAPGLRVVFCGTAASARSAAERAYYAHPGNRFWPTLHAIGLLPEPWPAARYEEVLTLGIGLTDLAKHHSGNDDQLPADAFDRVALEARIRAHAPGVLAFTSKNAAKGFMGRPVDYGWQQDTLGPTRLYVLCSPSGQARRAWRIELWQQLAEALPPLPSDGNGQV